MTRSKPTQFLHVEDNDGHADLFALSFEQVEGPSSLDRVADGIAAIEYLNGEGAYEARPRPDVVLLDLNLPRLHGLEVLRRLKADPNLHGIPVIVLTTSSDPEDVRQAFDLHANSYVCKPTDAPGFHEMVEAVVDFWSAWTEMPRNRISSTSPQ